MIRPVSSTPILSPCCWEETRNGSKRGLHQATFLLLCFKLFPGGFLHHPWALPYSLSFSYTVRCWGGDTFYFYCGFLSPWSCIFAGIFQELSLLFIELHSSVYFLFTVSSHLCWTSTLLAMKFSINIVLALQDTTRVEKILSPLSLELCHGRANLLFCEFLTTILYKMSNLRCFGSLYKFVRYARLSFQVCWKQMVKTFFLFILLILCNIQEVENFLLMPYSC